MPKMKSNRMAGKKFRVGGKGRVKHARAGVSHNSGKKPAKRVRQLKGRAVVERANISGIKGQLPYAGVKAK